MPHVCTNHTISSTNCPASDGFFQGRLEPMQEKSDMLTSGMETWQGKCLQVAVELENHPKFIQKWVNFY